MNFITLATPHLGFNINLYFYLNLISFLFVSIILWLFKKKKNLNEIKFKGVDKLLGKVLNFGAWVT